MKSLWAKSSSNCGTSFPFFLRLSPGGGVPPTAGLARESIWAESKEEQGQSGPSLGGASPTTLTILRSLTAPPPLTILRSGPGSALRGRRRCRGNGGTAEGRGEWAPADDRGYPQGSASPAADGDLRDGPLGQSRAGSSPKPCGSSSPRLSPLA